MAMTAQALKPPVHAPAPPVRRVKEATPSRAEAPQRLLTSLSAVPAVQRACAACSSSDDTVQRQVEEDENEVMARRESAAIRRMEDDEEAVMPRREGANVRRMEEEEKIMARREGAAKSRYGEASKTTVQPRLPVGAVNDPYEREADDIAGQVMAMREPGQANGAAPSVQRKCAGCGGEDEMPVQPLRKARIQRNPLSLVADAAKDEQDKVRMKEAGAGGETLGASANQLTSGGSALSPGTRDFFEARMGRDLSGVRVHKGSESDGLNSEISARAFTYKNHIWLGRNESESPSFTMAHEMAHVLQQTQPGTLDGIGGEAYARRVPMVQRTAARDPFRIFGGRPYWGSKEWNKKGGKSEGSHIHEHYLPAVANNDANLFYEVNIPLSKFGRTSTRTDKTTGEKKTRTPRARSGKPDLYKGLDAGGNPRTVAVNFVGPHKPRSLGWTPQNSHTRGYKHGHDSRPRLRGTSTVVGLSEAPNRIWLGDLKPHASIAQGQNELTEYETGLEKTRTTANTYVANHNTPEGQTPEQWARPSYNRVTAKAPDPQTVSSLRGVHDLAVYETLATLNPNEAKGSQFAKGKIVHEPPEPVKGKLRAGHDDNGIYYYYWDVTQGLMRQLPRDTLTTYFPVSVAMWNNLKTNRRHPIPSLPAAPAVAPRKSGNTKKFDNAFDDKKEAEWNARQKQLNKRYKDPDPKKGGRDNSTTVTNAYMVAIDKSMGKHSKGLEGKLKTSKAGRRLLSLRGLRMVSQKWAPLMAKVRKLFGGTFAKISEAYTRIKAKFNSKTKLSSGFSTGGILGTLIKTAVKVLKFIGRQVVASTMMRLTETLKSCMVKTFEKWFSIDDQLEVAETKIKAVEKGLKDRIDPFIQKKPEEIAEDLFGPYGKKLFAMIDTIEKFREGASYVATAVSVVKTAVYAIGCLSPPAIGCLWALAGEALMRAAAAVMNTCWFMKKVTPKILQIPSVGDFIRKTSTTLSNGILEAASTVLPDPIGAELAGCKQNPIKVKMPSAKSICDESKGEDGGVTGNDPKPDPKAIRFWQRWNALPYAKQMALKRILGRKAADGPQTADWGKMNKMLNWVEKTDLQTIEKTAAQAAAGNTSQVPKAVADIQAAANAAPTTPKPKQAKGKTPTQTQGTSPGGGDSGGGESDTSEKKKDSETVAVPGKMQGGRKVTVNWLVEIAGSPGLTVKTYNAKDAINPLTLKVRARDSDGDSFGPVNVQVTVHEVTKVGDGYMIRYTPVKDYMLERYFEGRGKLRLGLAARERNHELWELK